MDIRRSAGAAGAAFLLLAGGVGTALLVSGSSEAAADDKATFCSEFKPNEEATWAPGKMAAKWASQNPGERDGWTAFAVAICAGASPAPPPVASAHGKAIVAAGVMALPDAPPPTTTTTTTTPPSPSNRYTDINFVAGKYHGEGVESVFEAYQSDPRLSDWGGLPSDAYDDPTIIGRPGPGLTQDPNQRVHLFHPTDVGLPSLPGMTWASWQELRTTDGQWANGVPGLAKSSLNIGQVATWGPDSFSWGDERWWAFDILFPLNVGGVSTQFSSTWNVLGDLHSNGGDADPGLTEIHPTGNTHPKWLKFASTPDTQSIPYLTANLLQLTNADGSRVTPAHNVWHEVVFGLRAASDNSGWVEVWFNGQQKLGRTSRATFDPAEGGPYFQLQNYTAHPTSYAGGATRGTIVYGGFRAGLSRADVQTR